MRHAFLLYDLQGRTGHMNRKTLVALLGIGLIPSLLFGQFYRMDVDLQQPGQARVIDRVFTGNTVGLDVGFWDGDSPFAVTNWSMFFKYTDGQYSTNNMDTIPGTTSSNRVVFDSTTNIFYSASENYYFSIFGVDGAGRRRTFARGRMIEEYDPAASASLGVSTGGVYIVPWGGIYGDPASSTSLVAYVTGLIGEGEEPLWIAASNSVWYRSQAVTNAEDTVARAGVASNAVSIVAVESNVTALAETVGGITAESLGALTEEEDAAALAAVAGVQSNLTAHADNTENPHGVTAEQIGALTAETDEAALAAVAGVESNLQDLAETVGGITAESLGALTAESDTVALSAVAAVSGRVDVVEGWGDHGAAGYALSSALLSYLPSAQAATQYLSVTSAEAAYLPLAGHNGPVVLGTSIRGYGATTNVGNYGFAAGYSTTAGEFGFAAGAYTSAGDAGFAAGVDTSAGYAGFAAGEGAKPA